MAAELYNQETPKEEIERLKTFQFPDRVSVIEMGSVKNTTVIDVGAGPNRNLESYIKSRGGRYLALDINRALLKARISEEGNTASLTQADATKLPLKSESGERKLVHERFLLMNLRNDEEKKKAIKEAVRVAGKNGKCIFMDYNWGGFKAEGAVEEFGNLSKEYLSLNGVDINFGSRLRDFVEKELQNLKINATLTQTKYDRVNEGDYTELKGNLNSLSAVIQRSGDENFKKRWESMKKKLIPFLNKPERERPSFTPPTIVSLRLELI